MKHEMMTTHDSTRLDNHTCVLMLNDMIMIHAVIISEVMMIHAVTQTTHVMTIIYGLIQFMV